MTDMTHVSLFTGIGGMDLAAEWAGFSTIAQVERDSYCLKILKKHWPNVHKFGDIRDVTSNTLGGGSNTKPTILSGGFPCQPFSTAGKQKGQEDDRYLWPEMLRLVQELRPSWIIGENVAGIINLALDQVLSDLEGAGYSCRAFVVPAAGVGAPHIRDRVFIVANSTLKGVGRLSIQQGESLQKDSDTDWCCEDVAHAKSKRFDEGGLFKRKEPKLPMPRISGINVAYSNDPAPSRLGKYCGEVLQKPEAEGSDSCGCHVSNSCSTRLERSEQQGTYQKGTRKGKTGSPWSTSECCFNGRMQWAVEPGVGRVADGISNRVDRLRALGNAVVPQQVYPIFQAIADIERGVVS